ncbi:MAG: hypothetical protein P8171_19210 [Candidatus Thiodiazotropha sp.]|jgi:hypothetical protein
MIHSNTQTKEPTYELLAAALRDGVKSHKVEGEVISQYLDCKGCSKVD